MIYEFEDFVKFVAKAEFQRMKDLKAEGFKRQDVVDSDGELKEYVRIWSLIECFRDEHNLSYSIYDENGKVISTKELNKLLDDIWGENMTFDVLLWKE